MNKKSKEQRLRRELEKVGFYLKKSRVKTPNLDNMGGYLICDIVTGGVVEGRKFELSLEDVEEFLKDEQ